MLLVLVRRLGNVIPTLLAVIALVFLLFSVLPGSFISGMNEILLVGAILSFVGAALALLLVRRRDFVASGPQAASS